MAQDTDKSQIAQVTVWLLFIVAFFGAFARLGTRYAPSWKSTWDDKLMIMALVTYLAQCILVSLAVFQGLGKPVHTLTPESINGILEVEYASIPFFLSTLALVKWSLAVYVDNLSSSRVHRQMNFAFRIVVGLWLVSATLASLFQCAMPTPWDYFNEARCIDRRSWWTFVSALNIITEFVIIILHFLVIQGLQIPLSRKVAVFSVLLTRLLCFMRSLESGVVHVENAPESEERHRNRAGVDRRYFNGLSNSVGYSNPSVKGPHIAVALEVMSTRVPRVLPAYA
ncbi:hypothetical protein AAE478_008393 [Parahypoxylon ruwenzoriense]